VTQTVRVSALAAVRLPEATEPAAIAAGATGVGWDEASSTPYDRALTLQDCLRTFAYDLEVPPPDAPGSALGDWAPRTASPDDGPVRASGSR